jgi:hypothetical protein
MNKKHNEAQDQNKNDKESETDSGEDYEEYKEDPWYYTQESEANTDQAQPKTEDDLTLNSSPVDIGLPSSKEEKARPRQDLTMEVGQEPKQENRFKPQNDVLQKLFRPTPTNTPFSQDDRDEQESSSVEQTPPTLTLHEWGKTRQKTLQEHNNEWQVWNEVSPEGTTRAYRHGRCNQCNKPVSTTSRDLNRELLCDDCTPTVIEDDQPGQINAKQGSEKSNREDEEEWTRIPIPRFRLH